MAEFHFLRPSWLLALLPAFLIWWGYVRKSDQVERWRRTIDPHLLEHLLVGEHEQSKFRPINIVLATWLISIIALAGPAWQREPSPFTDDEAGLMVLLKVSETMKSTDVQPSRLERAKQKLKDLMELRQGSSTGLVVYSGSAHLVMPLTRDDRIINQMIEDLTPELMPVDGDELAQALQLGERIVGQTGLPGSLLVIADSVSPAQQSLLDDGKNGLPAQFLSMQPGNAPLDQGLQKSAKILGADVVRLSVDTTDVEQIAERAKTELSSVAGTEQGDHWRDSGLILLPLAAAFLLLWFRKGAVIR
jgi:Ca-activated chloride channel family protein